MLLGAAVVLALLAAIEGAARLVTRELALEEVHSDPFFGFFGLATFFERDPESAGWMRSQGGLGSTMLEERFALRPREDRLRLFCLGGSVTASPYPGFFERFLVDDLGLGGRVEVVGAGYKGMGTSRLLFMEREVLGYGPDLLVVSTGHNEALEQNFYRPLLERSSGVLATQAALRGSRAVGLMRWGARALLPELAPRRAVSPMDLDMRQRPMLAPPQSPVLRPPLGSVLDNYRRNLVSIVGMARESEVPLVLLELVTENPVHKGGHFPAWPDLLPRPTNDLFWGTPYRVVGADEKAPLGPGEGLLTLARGLNELEEGRAEQALALVRAARRDLPVGSPALFWEARCLEALGDHRGARACDRQARRRLDAERSTAEKNALLRGIAGVAAIPILDMPLCLAAAERELGDPYGSALFADHVHLTTFGYAYFGEAAGAFVEPLLARLDAPPPPSSAAAADTGTGARLERLARALDGLEQDHLRDPEGLRERAEPLARAEVHRSWARDPEGAPLLRRGWELEEDALVLAAIQRGLAVGGDSSCVDLVRAGVRHRSAAVRREAIEAAGRLGLVELGPLLLEGLAEEEPGCRRAIVAALGELCEVRARPALFDLAAELADAPSDRPVALLVACVVALGDLGTPEPAALAPGGTASTSVLLDLLIGLVGHPDARVARAAMWSATRLLRPHSGVLPGQPATIAARPGRLPWVAVPIPADPRAATTSATASLRHAAATPPPPALVSRIAGHLGSAKPTLRRSAFATLATIGGQTAHDALFAAPLPEDRDELAALVAAQSHLVAPADIPWLLELLAAPASEQRLSAALHLWRFPDPAVRAALRTALEREVADPELQVAMLVSLARAGADDVTPRLGVLLDDYLEQGDDSWMGQRNMRWVIETLGVLRDVPSMPLLARIAGDPVVVDELRSEAVWALGRIGPGDWIEIAAAALPGASFHRTLITLGALLRVASPAEVEALARRALS